MFARLTMPSEAEIDSHGNAAVQLAARWRVSHDREFYLIYLEYVYRHYYVCMKIY